MKRTVLENISSWFWHLEMRLHHRRLANQPAPRGVQRLFERLAKWFRGKAEE